MFDERYYKNKFVFIDQDGIATLIEVDQRLDGTEYMKFTADMGKSGKVAMYLIHDANEAFKNGIKVSLDFFLSENGYSKEYFKNPFGRTKKIVNEIDKINTSVINKKIYKDHAKIKVKRISK